MTSGERLRNWRKENHITAVEMAKSIDISTSMLTMYENGKTAISDKYLIRLQNIYKISIDWLLTGKKTEEINTIIPTEYQKLISLYEKLDKGHQEDLIRIAEAFLQHNQEQLSISTNSRKVS